MKLVDLPGGLSVDIVGESFHVAALKGLVDDGPRDRWASLIPDPSNAYDPNCIGVWIDGIQVGNLDREAAVVFHPVALRIIELGIEARCPATIGGGRGIYGVKLDLGAPDACLACLKGG